MTNAPEPELIDIVAEDQTYDDGDDWFELVATEPEDDDE